MKKTLLLSTLLISTSSWAASVNNLYKGVTIHVGMAMLDSDYSEFVNDLDEDTNSVTFGLSYTTPQRVIVGASFAPNILDFSATVTDGSSSVKANLESSLYTFYSGYQFDSGLRLVGGIGYSYSKIEIDTFSKSKKDFGPMIGIGYTAPFGLTADLHTTSAKFAAVTADGNYKTEDTFTTMLMMGYQF